MRRVALALLLGAACARPAALNEACGDRACAPGLRCEWGRCLGLAGWRGCRSGEDCADGACLAGACAPPTLGAPCGGDAACAQGELCLAGACYRRAGEFCDHPAVCASFACLEGRCAPMCAGKECVASACIRSVFGTTGCAHGERCVLGRCVSRSPPMGLPRAAVERLLSRVDRLSGE